jgi:predicted ATPase/DNA-binding winged helix-turn-helix (wHTH) protein
MDQHSDPTAIVEFGRFRLLRQRRELLADGIPLELGGRAFDVLIALIDAGGSVLSKDKLISRVWPGRIVEENNLQVQIAALRKALAADRDLVRTVAGRGYQFTGAIQSVSPAAPSAGTLPATNLTTAASELIGRDAEFGEVVELVKSHRLVTLTGAGGIGKTRLSLEVGRRLLAAFSGGVWVAELAPLSDPQVVPVTVAAALGLSLAAGASSPARVAAALGNKQVLLILDNCEHVIEAAAQMAETLLRANSLACVITTSREPLRAPGERIYRVPSLAVPAEDSQEPEDLMQSGAVRLFVARARAADLHFSPDHRTIAMMAAICRRLDGIPLAIELAAARTPALGVEGLTARLDDRFRLLTGGHRTALPRHQTLRATLDWSHELLPDAERVVLRRLAVFAGGFTLEAAANVAASGELGPADVEDCIVNLVAKSLLTAVGSAVAQYRLLETTRAYALEKLTQSGELERFAQRHAEHFRDVFQTAAAEWETRSTGEWLATYGRHTDNLRAALDWAFGPAGDPVLGVALAVAAIPLWMHWSLMEECRARVEQALASLGSEPGRDTRDSMQLYAALGLALMYTKGAVPETRSALTKALALAEHFDDTDYQLRALWGLCVDRLNNGVFREALTFAERFCSVAASAGDHVDAPIGDRMMGLSLHYLGDQVNARRHFERMLSRYVAPVRRSHMIRFQFDQRVTVHIALAEVLWLQGFPDAAMHAVESHIDEARALRHELSLCNALAKACPVALLAGDLATADRFVTALLDHSTRNSLASWQAEGRCFQAVLQIKRGDVGGAQALHAALQELPGINFSLRYTALLGELAESLGRTGAIEQGMLTIAEALARSERNEERWCSAELLRIEGELILLAGAQGAAIAAERRLRDGLDRARQQGALSWELRCATSLARLWNEQGSRRQARELLSAVYARFTEGFGSADLVEAKRLLETLA